MPDPFQETIKLISSKGDKLSQADVDDIDALLCELPLADYDELAGMAFEGLSLIINDPLYQGNAQAID